MTGYPSIDKPWLRFYTEEAIKSTFPNSSIYEYILNKNKDHPNDIAIRYFGNKISFKEMFSYIDMVADALITAGVKLFTCNSRSCLYYLRAQQNWRHSKHARPSI